MNEFNKELFSNLLIKAKGDRSISQYAQQCDVNKGYISSYINLKKSNAPSPQTIEKFCNTSQNSITYLSLMAAAGYYDKNITDKAFSTLLPQTYEDKGVYNLLNIGKNKEIKNNYFLPKDSDCTSSIPLIKKIQSVTTLFDNENIERYEYVKQSEANYGSFFYITVPDNSMINSRMRKGDLAYIKVQSSLTNGNIMLVLINNEAVIRKLYMVGNITVLIPDNPNYEPLIFNTSEIESSNLKLIGKVIHIKFEV
ncbi:LexA family protein [Clostridium estertheticum]|uniref:LexA family protein n=1 Tax=Clostridium estertheticum TaxID=238834 RepID=UPI001C7CD5EC|nr:S24 family peptidase [Clostridium estertheticum]MBX4271985.1 S24 family peptidase [Clostridium estertheticum]WLC80746.1 S24 family peptidase [Clostridium estertheticum]